MKILILSDIHSNYEALRAVAAAEAADQIWCLGDLVDYGPQPGEVVDWVRQHVRHCVRGNHDHALAFGEDCRCGKAFRELSHLSREMNRKLLSAEQIEFLRRLPVTRDIDVNGTRFRIAHATPRGDLYRYLLPSLTDQELAEELESVDAEFVFCGHTHFPMQRQIDGKLFVNPGSVGQPRADDPRACYAIWEDGVLRACCVEYDIAQTVKRLQASSLPAAAAQKLGQVLSTGGAPA